MGTLHQAKVDRYQAVALLRAEYPGGSSPASPVAPAIPLHGAAHFCFHGVLALVLGMTTDQPILEIPTQREEEAHPGIARVRDRRRPQALAR